MSSVDVGSASNMIRICEFKFLYETVMGDVSHRGFPYLCFVARFVCSSINLVDPASSHMLVSKIKPCMSQYQLLHGNTANRLIKTVIVYLMTLIIWIPLVILELIHAYRPES